MCLQTFFKSFCREKKRKKKEIKRKKKKMNEDRLLALEAQLDRIEKHCNNMTQHIGFIERVYNVLQAPFQMLVNFTTRAPQRLPDQELLTLS
jgi:hypothetical protein